MRKTLIQTLLAAFCAIPAHTSLEGGGVMLINMRNAMLSGGKKWKNPYITDGLVAMWDGIENAGWGVHDSNATVWKDLAGNCNFPLFGATINNESVVFSGAMSDSGMDLTNAAWLEIVFRVPSNKVFQMSFGSSGRGYLMLNSYGGVATRYASGRQFWISSPNGAITPTKVRTHSIDVSRSNLPTGRGIYYVNGQSVNLATTWLSSIWSSQQTAKIIGSATVSCIRLHSRALTADEIARNHAIDKERFNLP